MIFSAELLVQTVLSGLMVGVLYALHDRVLVHGSFRGIGSDVKFSFDDDFEYKFSRRFVSVVRSRKVSWKPSDLEMPRS